MKILFCFGTRPEWLKIKPIISKFDKKNYDIFFTGQHMDLIKDIDVDYSVTVGTNNNRLDDVITTCMIQFPNNFYDYVLVQGDTATSFGCALAAFNRKIKVVHLEAGLRTYDIDNPYPEESYRQMISRISHINLCPTKKSLKNLKRENNFGESFVVGNTILDSLVHLKSEVNYQNKVLITLHRRENHKIIKSWFEEINKVAEEYKELEFVLPLHPNPEIQKNKEVLSDRIKTIDPLPHKNLLDILKSCKFVITDSGGIQEEASFFNKKTIVCRKLTERPEGISTGHLIMCEDPRYLIKIVKKINKNYKINKKCPFGDGTSADKIIKILNKKW